MSGYKMLRHALVGCLLSIGTANIASAQGFGDAFEDEDDSSNELNEAEQAEMELILKLEACKETPNTKECQEFFIQYGEDLGVDLDRYILKEEPKEEVQEVEQEEVKETLVPTEVIEAPSSIVDWNTNLRNPNDVRQYYTSSSLALSGGVGYVANNPMVTRTASVLSGRYNIGNIVVYGNLRYYPDRGANDLKGLTMKLVEIASSRSGESNFEQPIEKVVFGTSFGVEVPLIYLGGVATKGSMLSAFGGVGMVSAKKYYAYSDSEVISLRYTGKTTHLPLNYGLRYETHRLNKSLGMLITAGFDNYRAPAPIYDPDDVGQQNSYRVYNDLTTSISLVWRP